VASCWRPDWRIEARILAILSRSKTAVSTSWIARQADQSHRTIEARYLPHMLNLDLVAIEPKADDATVTDAPPRFTITECGIKTLATYRSLAPVLDGPGLLSDRSPYHL
jgi:hypothetical protein